MLLRTKEFSNLVKSGCRFGERRKLVHGQQEEIGSDNIQCFRFNNLSTNRKQRKVTGQGGLVSHFPDLSNLLIDIILAMCSHSPYETPPTQILIPILPRPDKSVNQRWKARSPPK